MGDRTKLCDYTNTPNDQFIAKPITDDPQVQGVYRSTFDK